MNLRDLVRQLLLTSGKSITEATDVKDLERFIEKFRPKSVGKKLIRIGGKGDGGYLLPDDLSDISACFSPGVDVTSTFEEELAEKCSIKSFMADFSVDKPPIDNKFFHFDKKFLGNKNDEKFIRLEDWVKSNTNDNSDLILQMDIEGSEYEVIIDTPREVFKKFRIMAIEFHSLDMIFNKNAFKMVEAVFDKLSSDFTVAHIHPNNCCGTYKIKEMVIPSTLEITFLNKELTLKKEKIESIQNELDFKNIEHKPDIFLDKNWY